MFFEGFRLLDVDADLLNLSSYAQSHHNTFETDPLMYTTVTNKQQTVQVWIRTRIYIRYWFRIMSNKKGKIPVPKQKFIYSTNLGITLRV